MSNDNRTLHSTAAQRPGQRGRLRNMWSENCTESLRALPISALAFVNNVGMLLNKLVLVISTGNIQNIGNEWSVNTRWQGYMFYNVNNKAWSMVFCNEWLLFSQCPFAFSNALMSWGQILMSFSVHTGEILFSSQRVSVMTAHWNQFQDRYILI